MESKERSPSGALRSKRLIFCYNNLLQKVGLTPSLYISHRVRNGWLCEAKSSLFVLVKIISISIMEAVLKGRN
jgi:hypothetical protein